MNLISRERRTIVNIIDKKKNNAVPNNYVRVTNKNSFCTLAITGYIAMSVTTILG